MMGFFTPILEISIISVFVYYFLSFFWNTRAMDLLLGLLVFTFLYLSALWLNLPVLQKLMVQFAGVAVIAFLVIFQPELRIALSKLSIKGKRYRELSEFDKFLDGITQTVYRLSEKQIGGLILLENQDSLDEYAYKGVILNAQFSSELLETLFMPITPLHDGAVIIRGTTILAAASILPLADDSTQISKSMGTRHRAGLGISQITDALIIVISEESGKVSIARDGIMSRGVKPDRFKGIIRSVFTPPQGRLEARFSFLERLKQWKF